MFSDLSYHWLNCYYNKRVINCRGNYPEFCLTFSSSCNSSYCLALKESPPYYYSIGLSYHLVSPTFIAELNATK